MRTDPQWLIWQMEDFGGSESNEPVPTSTVLLDVMYWALLYRAAREPSRVSQVHRELAVDMH